MPQSPEAPADSGPTTLHLMAGTITGTNLKLCNDLARHLDDDDFRVLPMVGKGSLQGARDLLDLSVLDVATLPSNVLAFEALKASHGDVAGRLAVIAKLFNEELHVVAPRSCATIDALAGKQVNFGPATSGGHVTSRLVFKALGIDVQVRELEQTDAPAALMSGDIDALSRLVGSPVGEFETITEDQGLHLLPIPLERLAGAYLETTFSAGLYPGLVAPERPVRTAAVASLLACRHLDRGNPRRAVLATFAERLRAALPELARGSYHPKWTEASMEVAIPGWQAF